VPVAAVMAVGCGRRSMTGRVVGALTAVAVAMLALAGAARANDHGRCVVRAGLIMPAPWVGWPTWCGDVPDVAGRFGCRVQLELLASTTGRGVRLSFFLWY